MKKNINLSPRLKKIAALIPIGAFIADVGTDHGYLPICLLLDGKISGAVATDIRFMPLQKAIHNAKEYGVNLLCIQTDGLNNIPRGKIDTVIIAGMGGENIVRIIEETEWIYELKHLILQPMSKAELVRDFLCEHGFFTIDETLVEDKNHLYSIIHAAPGLPESMAASERYLGRMHHIRSDPLFKQWLALYKQKLQHCIASLDSSENEITGIKKQEFISLLQEIIHFEENCHDYN